MWAGDATASTLPAGPRSPWSPAAGCWVSLTSPLLPPWGPQAAPHGCPWRAGTRRAPRRRLWKSVALPPLARVSLGRSPIPGLEEGGYRRPSPLVPPSLPSPTGPARGVPTGDTGERHGARCPCGRVVGILRTRAARGGMLPSPLCPLPARHHLTARYFPGVKAAGRDGGGDEGDTGGCLSCWLERGVMRNGHGLGGTKEGEVDGAQRRRPHPESFALSLRMRPSGCQGVPAGGIGMRLGCHRGSPGRPGGRSTARRPAGASGCWVSRSRGVWGGCSAPALFWEDPPAHPPTKPPEPFLPRATLRSPSPQHPGGAARPGGDARACPARPPPPPREGLTLAGAASLGRGPWSGFFCPPAPPRPPTGHGCRG